jgi:glucosamine--fructose-6-phosphate aminotransferase (isomerizing)
MNVTTQEIASQPDVWQRAVALAAEAGSILTAPGERVLFLGCGTSWFVAQALATLREGAGLGESDYWCASEYRFPRRYDRVVAITRSGTTTEVLDVLRDVPAGTRRSLVTAVDGMPAEGLADDRILLDFADERSVVQTRFPTSVLALARTAFGTGTDGLVEDGRTAVDGPLPALPGEPAHVVFLGTGWTIGLAHEAALKVREAAQGWSESYPAMDFRHGPIAVAGARTLVWSFGPLPDGLAEEIAGAGAALYTSSLDPLAQLVLAQRLAVALAQARGLDPDAPRLLTRSVVLTG